MWVNNKTDKGLFFFFVILHVIWKWVFYMIGEEEGKREQEEQESRLGKARAYKEGRLRWVV